MAWLDIHQSVKQEWDGTIAFLRDRSIWNSAWSGKPDVNMYFRKFLGVFCVKNLRESRISSPPRGFPSVIEVEEGDSMISIEQPFETNYSIRSVLKTGNTSACFITTLCLFCFSRWSNFKCMPLVLSIFLYYLGRHLTQFLDILLLRKFL